jgi:hypothetical protein
MRLSRIIETRASDFHSVSSPPIPWRSTARDRVVRTETSAADRPAADDGCLPFSNRTRRFPNAPGRFPGGRHQTRPVDRERRVGRPAAMPRARVEQVAGRGLLRKGGGRAQLTVDPCTQHERQHQNPGKQKLCAPNRPREGLESSLPTSRGPSAFRRHFRDLVGSVNAVAEGFQALRRPPT